MLPRRLPNALLPTPAPLELPQSYAWRVESKLGINQGFLSYRASKLKAPEKRGDPTGRLCKVLESVSGIPSTAFDYGTEEVYPLPATRLACLQCYPDAHVEVLPHLKGFCCRKHTAWTGPQPKDPNTKRNRRYEPPTPEKDTGRHVPNTVVEADRIYRKMRQAGQIPLGAVQEVLYVITGDANEFICPDTFINLVEILELINSQRFQQRILDPFTAFAHRRQRLKEELNSITPSQSGPVANRLWNLLRPAMLAVREYVEGAPVGRTGIIKLTPEKIAESFSPAYPLEPFERSLTKPTAETWPSWSEHHLVAGQYATPRTNMKQGIKTTEFICSAGHRYHSTPNTAFRALAEGRPGCAYCAGYMALAGYNSMNETHPHLAHQWHPTRNGTLTPSQITGANNSAKHWWLCDDGHSWEESANNRAKGRGCPYCSGRRAIPHQTSLAATHPQIAKEWYAAPDGLTPDNIRPGSGRKVTWKCSKGHLYSSPVENRTQGKGCRICANLKIQPGFNDLATTRPDLAKEWDPAKNHPVTPEHVVAGSGGKFWWICHRGHSYEATCDNRNNGKGCPFCAGQKVLAGFNDLATTHPHIAARWDHQRNETSPTGVSAGSSKKAFFLCPEGHSHEAQIAKHTNRKSCPYCTNRRVLSGFNDLAARYPSIARDWHPTKNGDLTPSGVLPGNKKRWWLCRNGHEQHGTVPNRVKTNGCSSCLQEERVGA